MPVINSTLLRDYLFQHRIGRFSDPEHRDRAISFEPAVVTESFHYSPRINGRRTFLFYARPISGVRNLFEIGVAAIQTAIDQGLLDPEEWSFIGMGEPFTPLSLGRGATLECAPWLGFDDYAAQMRQADVLLSLMLSPHPSYPPLEMAACGGLAITSVYANKTAERMAEISPKHHRRGADDYGRHGRDPRGSGPSVRSAVAQGRGTASAPPELGTKASRRSCLRSRDN